MDTLVLATLKDLLIMFFVNCEVCCNGDKVTLSFIVVTSKNSSIDRQAPIF